jgi:Ca2+-binding RTX toxin-like protein
MSFAPEAVTQPGSGLVFLNYYDAGVTSAYRGAIVAAEHQLQTWFTNPVTIGVEFDLQSLGSKFAAQNSFSTVSVGYAAFAQALRNHAISGDDQLAVNGLPATDPSGGRGFSIPTGEATILGLAPQTNSLNLTVTLNSDIAWSYGQDAIGALQHEITEGAFGRVGSLGVADSKWAPMDLFRFTAAGQRDTTGGSDGQTSYFGVDAAHVTTLAYHNAVSATGAYDGFDLADWEGTRGDAFGPASSGAPGVVSATDQRVLDVLGWNSTPFAPAPDDFASSIGPAATYGLVGVGGSASGVLEQAGDRDLFRVTLSAGASYQIDLIGHAGGGGTLGDPYLRLHAPTGALIATNDDIVDGSNPDSRLVFTAPTTGVYDIEAGGFADGYAGTYRVRVNLAAAASPTAGDDLLTGHAGGDSINAQAGNDTIIGQSGHNVFLGFDGNDVITGGPDVNEINGNKGDDTIVSTSSLGDTLFGGQGNDLIQVQGAAGDAANGNMGNDTVLGGPGADTLWGGQGDDSIDGGAGADWISGDRGHDTVTGGLGADTFHQFPGGGVMTVTDFNAAAGDRVELDLGAQYTVSQSGLDTLVDLGGGTQVLLKNVDSTKLQPGWIFLG